MSENSSPAPNQGYPQPVSTPASSARLSEAEFQNIRDSPNADARYDATGENALDLSAEHEGFEILGDVSVARLEFHDLALGTVVLDDIRIGSGDDFGYILQQIRKKKGLSKFENVQLWDMDPKDPLNSADDSSNGESVTAVQVYTVDLKLVKSKDGGPTEIRTATELRVVIPAGDKQYTFPDSTSMKDISAEGVPGCKAFLEAGNEVWAQFGDGNAVCGLNRFIELCKENGHAHAALMDFVGDMADDVLLKNDELMKCLNRLLGLDSDSSWAYFDFFFKADKVGRRILRLVWNKDKFLKNATEYVKAGMLKGLYDALPYVRCDDARSLFMECFKAFDDKSLGLVDWRCPMVLLADRVEHFPDVKLGDLRDLIPRDDQELKEHLRLFEQIMARHPFPQTRLINHFPNAAKFLYDTWWASDEEQRASWEEREARGFVNNYTSEREFTMLEFDEGLVEFLHITTSISPRADAILKAWVDKSNRGPTDTRGQGDAKSAAAIFTAQDEISADDQRNDSNARSWSEWNPFSNWANKER